MLATSVLLFPMFFKGYLNCSGLTLMSLASCTHLSISKACFSIMVSPDGQITAGLIKSHSFTLMLSQTPMGTVNTVRLLEILWCRVIQSPFSQADMRSKFGFRSDCIWSTDSDGQTFETLTLHVTAGQVKFNAVYPILTEMSHIQCRFPHWKRAWQHWEKE